MSGWDETGTLRNWVFATKSDFLIHISLQPDVVDLNISTMNSIRKYILRLK